MKSKTEFITHDSPMKKGGVLSEADRQVLKTAETGEGVIKIEAKQLETMARMANETFNHFSKFAVTISAEQAEFVRDLRVDKGYSWRAVAETCYEKWNGDWKPPSNQLMGMTLCEEAAKRFGEEYMTPPWN